MNLQTIFINNYGRLRSGWRLTVFAILLILAFIVFGSIPQIFLTILLGQRAAVILEGTWGFIIQGLVMVAPAILIGWACCRNLEGLPFRALGWALTGRWLRDWVVGTILGALSLVVAVGIAALAGGYSFAMGPASPAAIARTLLVSAVIFVIAAAGEEAVFRGYPLQTMARARLAWVAIVLTSILFAQGHLSNPNVAPVFTLLNTTLAGVWLAVAYLRTRSLWFPLGLHWSWNWMMAAVLGVPVSGITRLTPSPLVNAIDRGPAWLTGGAYGIEGGIACSVALVISLLFVWKTRMVSADPELLELTSREIPTNDAPKRVPRQPEDKNTQPPILDEVPAAED